jgi:ABC-type multidrug transport system ATPase subunit
MVRANPLSWAFCRATLEQDEGSIVSQPSGNGLSSDKNCRISLVPQNLALYQDLSVIANLKAFGAIMGVSGISLNERIETLLKEANLQGQKKGYCQDTIGRHDASAQHHYCDAQ